MEDTSLTHWQFITAKVLYNPYYMKMLIKETLNLSPRVHRRTGNLLLGDTLLCAAPRLREIKMQRKKERKRPRRNYFSLNGNNAAGINIWVSPSAFLHEKLGLSSGNSCSFTGFKGPNQHAGTADWFCPHIDTHRGTQMRKQLQKYMRAVSESTDELEGRQAPHSHLNYLSANSLCGAA